MKIDTLCIHGSDTKYDSTGAISVPIFQSATFAHPGVGLSTGFDYSRLQNPTREHLEKTIARLENGYDAMAFSAGMAAIAALMELFSPGDHFIVRTIFMAVPTGCSVTYPPRTGLRSTLQIPRTYQRLLRS